MAMAKVKLDKDLLGRAAKVAETAGYSTVEEFLTHLIEKELSKVEDAVDVLRRAFNHSELDRMWKIYFSMWVVGLQRRLEQFRRHTRFALPHVEDCASDAALTQSAQD